MMRTTACSTVVSPLVAMLLLVGCAHVPNQWIEDGPTTAGDGDSPTAKDVYAHYAPAQQRQRDWSSASVSAEPGAVTHWPLYFEDPFVDKGHGRTGLNKYHIGWEDYVAMPYCYARFTLNWLMLPLSAVVTPPCVLMESDGRLSRQALGYDHDATRADRHDSEPSAAKDVEDDTQAGDTEPTNAAET
jgi:hypothetical protein